MFPPYLSSQKPGEYKRAPWFSSGVHEMSTRGNGGYEFNLALWTVAVAVAATGPSRLSIDNALGWADNLSG